MEEKELTEKESFDLITSMILQAKQYNHDTGLGAILWGTVITICSLTSWASIQFKFQLPFNIYYLTLLAVFPQILISIKEKKERKVRTDTDTFIATTWIVFGISMGLLSLITAIQYGAWSDFVATYKAANGVGPSFKMYEYLSAFYLLIYGIPTIVSGVVCKFRHMLLGGILCWVISAITLFTPGKTDLLLTALAAICAWLIPGIIMEKAYRKAKKQLKVLNV